MYLRYSGLFWVGVAALVFGAGGAVLFGRFVAADHAIDPKTSKLGVSNLDAVTSSDTAWMWGCIVVAVLGAVVITVAYVRARRG